MFNKANIREILEKKEIEEGKESKYEKGDFLALMIAAISVFLPIVLIFFGAIAVFIWLITSYIH